MHFYYLSKKMFIFLLLDILGPISIFLLDILGSVGFVFVCPHVSMFMIYRYSYMAKLFKHIFIIVGNT